MKALLAAMLLAFCLLCACHRAEQDEPAKNTFQETKAKAEQGDAGAQFMLGNAYRKGEGVAKDSVEAVKWYRKAAEQGDAHAQYNLGLCYDNGYGVAKDLVEAVKWFRKAAEQGNAGAQYDLGNAYENGEGVAKDFAEAVKWYRKAAEQGDADAQCMLGNCYYNGNGVEKNYVETYAWLNLASTKDKDVGKVRDSLEKEMSPQQVADAQKRTKELRAIVEASAKAKAK